MEKPFKQVRFQVEVCGQCPFIKWDKQKHKFWCDNYVLDDDRRGEFIEYDDVITSIPDCCPLEDAIWSKEDIDRIKQDAEKLYNELNCPGCAVKAKRWEELKKRIDNLVTCRTEIKKNIEIPGFDEFYQATKVVLTIKDIIKELDEGE